MTADVHELRWGYNLADLDQLTRTALWRPIATNLPLDDRYQIAWSAIAENLYTCENRPEPAALVNAGRRALGDALDAECHHHGWDRREGRTWPGYAAYWIGLRVSSDPAPRVVDRAALWQIWSQLEERHRVALLALATHEDYQAAADAMGVPYATYVTRVRRARHAFYALWHEGETPSRPWGTDRRQGSKDRSITSVLAKRQRQRRHREERAA